MLKQHRPSRTGPSEPGRRIFRHSNSNVLAHDHLKTVAGGHHHRRIGVEEVALARRVMAFLPDQHRPGRPQGRQCNAGLSDQRIVGFGRGEPVGPAGRLIQHDPSKKRSIGQHVDRQQHHHSDRRQQRQREHPDGSVEVAEPEGPEKADQHTADAHYADQPETRNHENLQSDQ
ncbi:hypothetical protein SDC9_65823 [bioreactor metagenome]|uniref:Uncharacterized protein n=1 Tax=bioreactor metagenome TaxID=1076179 RepID=A0A644XT69_9ZZZZ